MAVALVWPNRTALWALKGRFPSLRSGGVEGELIGDCPVPHDGNMQAVFVARELDDGWAIAHCDLGCRPKEIYDSGAQLDQPEQGEDRDEPAPKPGWGFQTAAEFLARVFPPLRWLYLDLIPAEGVTVVMAAPNAGKTFFALDVVAQVAVKAATDGVTVWIVEEEGTGGALQWRLSRALASVGIDIRHEAANRIHIAWNTGRSLRNKEHLASLASECQGAELIMLDSLSALAGGIDENNSKDMAEVAEALHALKAQTGAAIMPLHHMTKAAWKEGETPRLEHMRGHGALPGRADAVLALVPLESNEEEVRFELHCVKQRDGSKPRAKVFSIAMKGLAAIASIKDKEELPRNSPADKTSAVMSRVLEAVRKALNPVSKNFLCNTIQGRDGDIRKAVDRLVDVGSIIQIGIGRYTGAAGAAQVLPGSGAAGTAPLKGGGSTPGMPQGRKHWQQEDDTP